MDLIILIILLVLVIIFFRRFSNFVYAVAIIDIFLRIVDFIKDEFCKGEVFAFLNKYFPASVPTIIGNYSSGVLYKAFFYAYVVVFCIFEFYIIRTFIKKKK